MSLRSTSTTGGVTALTSRGSQNGPVDELSLVERALFDSSKHHTVRAMASSSFMIDVQDLGNPFWLVREFVQNFVDANTGKNKASLNDVSCNVSQDEVNIAGNWSFENYNDLVTFGTSKILVDEYGKACADLFQAGGIGIGIKQCALVMLRDKGVESFEIRGKDWLLKYRLVEPAEINQKLKPQGTNKEIKGSYFIAEVEKADPQDTCSYRLRSTKANGRELLAAFKHFHDLGEHRDHPALQDMDFSCEFGSIKILGKDARGVLMMNGQRRSFQMDNHNGSFRGTKGLTVTIHNEIPRSFHRGPISDDTLAHFVKPIVDQMSQDEAKALLKKSFQLWSNNNWDPSDFNRDGYHVLIEELVNKLAENKFGLKDLEKLLPDTKFIYVNDKELTRKEKNDLLAAEAEDGKALVTCPLVFKSIGVPEKTLDRAFRDHGDRGRVDILTLIRQQATQVQTVGLPVNYEEISGLTKPEELFDLMHLRLNAAPSNRDSINEVNDLGQGRFRIYMNTGIDKGLIANQFLNANKFADLPRAQAEHILFLRGLAHHGVRSEALLSLRSMISDTLVDYTVIADNKSSSELIIKTQEARQKTNTDFIEIQIKPEYISEFKTRFIDKLSPSKFRVIQQLDQNLQPQTPNPNKASVKQADPDAPTLGDQILNGTLYSAGALLVSMLIWVGAAMVNLNQDKQTPPAPALSPLDNIEKEVSKTVKEHVTPSGDADSYRRRQEILDRYANRGNTSEGSSLDEFVLGQETAKVKPKKSPELTTEEKRITKLQGMLNRLNSAEHKIDNFSPVMYPHEIEIHKIELLKRFMSLATGVKQDYDLFIFEGDGALGVNMPNKGGIGIHREVLTGPMHKALGTLSHELSHEKLEGNYKHGDLVFYQRLEALLAATVNHLINIGAKPFNERTPEENELLDIAKQWNELNPSIDPLKGIKH